MTNFNDRLKEALRLRQMTQVDLCEMTGIPKSAMSQYISGAFKPKNDRLCTIAKALNVSEAWLMGYSDNPTVELYKHIEPPLTETQVEIRRMLQGLNRLGLAKVLVFVLEMLDEQCSTAQQEDTE